MKKTVLILSLLILTSCREKEQTKPVIPDPSSPSLNDTLQLSARRRVLLTPEAKEQVAQWLPYIAARDAVASLDRKTGTELVASASTVLQIMDRLQASLPDTLRTAAIQSRTNVLLTKAHVLQQLALEEEKEISSIFEAAQELNIAFDNFELQLNELFLKDPVDFETELDREFEASKSEQEQ